MTSLEHLIDSAIYYVEHYSFKDFKDTWATNVNKKSVAAPLEEIWVIANYIYYTYRPYIEDVVRAEMIETYGYEVKDEWP